VPFRSWQDKSYKYEPAFDHLLDNLLRAVRFRKLVLVLPEWFRIDGFHTCIDDQCSSSLNHHYQSGIHNYSMWKAFTAFVEEKSKQERGIAFGITIEIVRLCDEGKVMHDEGMTEIESWEAHSDEIHPHHKFLIREILKLATDKLKVEVKGAYVSGIGAWEIIEDLPEDALLPVPDEETEVVEAGDVVKVETEDEEADNFDDVDEIKEFEQGEEVKVVLGIVDAHVVLQV
jgi:hypothetical protein